MDSCTFTFDPATDARRGDGAESMDGEWRCPHEAHPDAQRCVFHLPADRRAELDVDPGEIADRFLALFETPDPERKRLVGASLPTVHLEYRRLEGASRHPIDLRFSDIDGLELDHTTVGNPLDLRGARLGRLDLTESEFENGLSLSGARIDGGVTVRDGQFAEEVEFAGVEFGDTVSFQGAEFDDELVFDGAVFEREASFAGAEFHGRSNVREDNTSFRGARFRARATFEEAVFEYVAFADTHFEGEAIFQSATFAGDATFDDAVFEELADFDEGRFQEDASFKRIEFRGTADFRGVEIEGGANVLDDDADFQASTFHGPARFEDAEIAFTDFHDAVFARDAVFEATTFAEDADFRGVTFRALADFDEARFHADGDFADVRFEGPADFRGVEFLGEARHLADNARFEGAVFEGQTEFDDAVFTSANFRDVTFGATVDFQRTVFRDRLDMAAESEGETVYVNMTGADVAEGTIAQPDDHWVRYDLTRAHVGNVGLTAASGAHDLFDYFRFLETDFEGFDFSAHREALERNDWNLHEFDESGTDYEVALAATPGTVETTYLYAYNNAKAMGDNDAAIEFAIHQARFRRKKNVAYVGDGTLSVGYRLGKLGDVIGNFLWHTTCGYGYRLWRILAASLFVIVTWAVLYALPFTRLDNEASVESVGALASADGIATLGQYLYYSLITFTTVGYGDINPVNGAARTLAVTEGVLGVLLAALVVFVLGRRVAV